MKVPATEDGGCSVVLLMYCSSLVTSVRVGSGRWQLRSPAVVSAPSRPQHCRCMMLHADLQISWLQDAAHCSMPSQRVRSRQWWVRFRCVTRRAAKPRDDECHRSRQYRHRQHQLGRRGGNWQSNIVPSSGPGINLEHWTFVVLLLQLS